jgi:hypothetical protein
LSQEDNEENDERLVNSVTKHVSPHHLSHDRSIFLVRLSLKNRVLGWLCS